MKKNTNEAWPTELVAKAKYELRIFERVAMDTGAELVAEVERLRGIIQRAKEHSTRITHDGQSVVIVPSWFVDEQDEQQVKPHEKG